MTEEPIFFDNDCISAFLWVDETSIIAKLYGNRIFMPIQVYSELSRCRGQAAILKQRIDKMFADSQITIVDMSTDSKEYELYTSLSINPPIGVKRIGDGEAACIALAKERNGILASNNFSDTAKYIKEFHLNYITTGDILIEAYRQQLITKEQAEIIWNEMLARRRKLGATSFQEYLDNKNIF